MPTVVGLRMKTIFWSVARGQTVVCVQLTMNYLDCSTDAVRLLWATQEVHTGTMVPSCKACR